MNIGIVVRSLRIGGMERVAANLSDAFQKEGHTVTLIYLKNKPVEIVPENKNTDIRLIDLDKILIKTGIGVLWLMISGMLNVFIRKSLFIWKGMVQSQIFKNEIKKIEKEKGLFDLLIIRGQGTFELIWNFKDDRVILVCENIFPKNKTGKLQSGYSKLLFNGKNVVCVSNGVLENFLEYQKKTNIQPKRLKMITNPIDTENIKVRSGLRIPDIPDYSYILGLGRLVRQKNFHLLINAYKILIEDYGIKQNLVVVGDGNQKEHLVALVEKAEINSRVFFPGATDNPYAWMSNAELFVLSSDFEGLGMVIIEAFASGTNVVATNSPGGVKDIMMTGSLSEQLSAIDPENLAKVIYNTLKNPFPAYDIEMVLEKFKPENITSGYYNYHSE